MDKWPSELKRDMELVFIQSPELLEILKEEKEFEDMINTRSFEESSEELEDRIIQSAMEEPHITTPQNNESFISAILSIIPVPHPAFALSLLLVIGIGIGFFYSASFSSDEQMEVDGAQFAELIYYEEGLYE